MKPSIDTYDVIVIGGGPAGMMAAATAAKHNLSVVLLEKNAVVGKKLSITGGGRCNVTNNKPEVREMVERYKESGKFLFSTFTQHGVAESIAWFKERGVLLREENEGRLFPTTNQAVTITKALSDELRQSGVEVVCNGAVASVTKSEDIFYIKTTEGVGYRAKQCVLATGGRSRPDTGSTGEGFGWVESLGHTVTESSLALVPVVSKERWVTSVSGLTLSDVSLAIYADGIKQQVEIGKLLFTHVGVSGPLVLQQSSVIGQLLQHSSVTMQIDLFPTLDMGTLRTQVTETLQDTSNQTARNSLSALAPKALVSVMLEELNIDPATPTHSLLAADRKRICTWCKAVPLTVARLLGADKAVISGGGVALEEVNFKTMESRVVPGLFLVGDVLDIDRPSGGYSLQLCWSTGAVAGAHVGTAAG